MMTGRRRLVAIGVTITAVVAVSTAASASMAGAADRESNNFRITLNGYEETLLSLSTSGEGSLRVSIDEDNQEITYRLSYAKLEGAATQAHIHIGQRAQGGGIIVFLCTNQGNGPAGTPVCPPAPATVTGTLTPDSINVATSTAHGIVAGEFGEVIAAIRAGATYANVHSQKYGTGEIRGQIEQSHH